MFIKIDFFSNGLPAAPANCLLLSLFHAKSQGRKETPNSILLTHYSILTTHYSFTNLLTIKSGVMSAELGVFLFHYFTLNSVLKTHYSLINFFTSIPFSVFTFTM
jgi:hypothetical protein